MNAQPKTIVCNYGVLKTRKYKMKSHKKVSNTNGTGFIRYNYN